MAARKRTSVANKKGQARRKKDEEFRWSGVLPQQIPVRLQVFGYPVGEHLAVTRDYGRKSKWNITHQVSGKIVNSSYTFRTAEAAFKAAMEIEALGIPWNRMSDTDAEHNRRVAGAKKDKMMDILQKYSEGELK